MQNTSLFKNCWKHGFKILKMCNVATALYKQWLISTFSYHRERVGSREIQMSVLGNTVPVQKIHESISHHTF